MVDGSPSAEADSPSKKEWKSQRKNPRSITRGASSMGICLLLSPQGGGLIWPNFWDMLANNWGRDGQRAGWFVDGFTRKSPFPRL